FIDLASKTFRTNNAPPHQPGTAYLPSTLDIRQYLLSTYQSVPSLDVGRVPLVLVEPVPLGDRLARERAADQLDRLLDGLVHAHERVLDLDRDGVVVAAAAQSGEEVLPEGLGVTEADRAVRP